VPRRSGCRRGSAWLIRRTKSPEPHRPCGHEGECGSAWSWVSCRAWISPPPHGPEAVLPRDLTRHVSVPIRMQVTAPIARRVQSRNCAGAAGRNVSFPIAAAGASPESCILREQRLDSWGLCDRPEPSVVRWQSKAMKRGSRFHTCAPGYPGIRGRNDPRKGRDKEVS